MAKMTAGEFDTFGPVTARGTVYPWHCDHMGHMNVTWYVNKFDDATWNYFASLGLTLAYFDKHHSGMAAVQQNITYEKELLAGDTVAVTTQTRGVRGKTLYFVHRLYNAQTGERAALCDLTVVHLDRKMRRAIPFEPELAEAIKATIVEDGD